MKTIKVSEATSIQLDWLVAKCNGDFALYHNIEEGQRFLNLWTGSAFLKYSTLWSCGGPIIERERLCARPLKEVWGCWVTDLYGDIHALSLSGFGPTPLIAAMRCYVSSKFGDEVAVPDELLS